MRAGKATAGGRKGIKKAGPKLWTGAVSLGAYLLVRRGRSHIPARGRLP